MVWMNEELAGNPSDGVDCSSAPLLESEDADSGVNPITNGEECGPYIEGEG
jgi:hypothetical protein